MRPLFKKLIFIGAFLVLLGLDALLKSYAFHNIPTMGALHPFYPYGGVGVFQDFYQVTFAIVSVTNKGAAWGFLANSPNFLWWLRFIIIGFLAAYLFLRKVDWKRFAALGLVLTGAVGNLLDRFFYGSVVDMFYFQFGSYNYPVFNLADSYITIGIIWFLLSSLKEMKGHEN